LNDDILKALIQAGGAIAALGFVWLILKALMPAFVKKSGNGKFASASGDKSVEFWQKNIEDSVERAVQRAMLGRNEELRKNVTGPIVEEIKSTRHDLRNEIARWAVSGKIEPR
jgi:hypothetical protein